MKKLLWIFLLASASAQVITPNLGMSEPVVGMSQNTWGPLINGNTDILDNIFSIASCGDSTHAVGWNLSAKRLTCQAIAGSVSSVFGQTGAVANLSGDITTSGSSATTLATVNSNVGSFYGANVTVNAKGLVTVAANGPVVDASTFSGANWLLKVIAAATSISNVGTVTVPASLASTAAYPSGTIPSGITTVFTGGGNFGVCSLTIGQFGKIYNPGAAVLVMDVGGSACTGVTHTVQAALGTNDRTILDGVRVNCNSQPSSQGITFTGGSAQDAFDHVSVQGCGTVAGGAGLFLQDQFGSFHDVSLQQNYVNLKMYTTDAQPGVSSNTFYNLKTQAPGSGVNVILSNSNTGGQVQNDTVFINHQCQNGTIACVAVFGGTSGYIYARWVGGAPELNNGGASSIVIDGLTIKQAGGWYINNATVSLDQMDFDDGTADPDIVVENHGNLTITNSSGYGPQYGKLATADSTSFINLSGSLGTNGTMTGIGSFPSTITSGRGALAGSPVSYLNSSVPNAYAGNPLTPAFSSTTGTSSNATAIDSLYGTVNTATYASSPGSSSTNRIVVSNAIPSPGVTSDYLISVLVKASVATTVTCYGQGSGFGMGFLFGSTLPLAAAQWTRIVMWNYSITGAVDFTCFPTDSAGATVSFTRLESLSFPNGSTDGTATGQSSAWARAQVLQSGAVNPNGFRNDVNVFSALPACASGYEGRTAAISDSSTVTWGATITGGSTNHVLGYCNGTNWTVTAK